MHVFLQHGVYECLVWSFSSVMLRVCGVSVPEPILQASFAGHAETWTFPVLDSPYIFYMSTL